MATKPRPKRPERLSADEVAYQKRLASQLSVVQGAWQLWESHLREKYLLQPGDSITQDGEVIRGDAEDVA